MTDTEEVRRRIRSKVAEIALRHGRQNTPEFEAETQEALKEILSEYPGLVPEQEKWALDPTWEVDLEKRRISGKVWIGGLPPPTLVPPMDDPDYDDDPEGV